MNCEQMADFLREDADRLDRQRELEAAGVAVILAGGALFGAFLAWLNAGSFQVRRTLGLA
jgi:hypothetical protein